MRSLSTDENAPRYKIAFCPNAKAFTGEGGGGRGEGTRPPRDALAGKGPQRQPQKLWSRRLEEVAKAVGGGSCRLQTPLKLALGVRGTVAGHRLGALEGEGGTSPPSNASLPPPPPVATPPSFHPDVGGGGIACSGGDRGYIC